MKKCFLILYLLFFKHLPATNGNYPMRSIIRRMRSSVGKYLFDKCGNSINIEKGPILVKGMVLQLVIIQVLALIVM